MRLVPGSVRDGDGRGTLRDLRRLYPETEGSLGWGRVRGGCETPDDSPGPQDLSRLTRGVKSPDPLVWVRIDDRKGDSRHETRQIPEGPCPSTQTRDSVHLSCPSTGGGL